MQCSALVTSVVIAYDIWREILWQATAMGGIRGEKEREKIIPDVEIQKDSLFRSKTSPALLVPLYVTHSHLSLCSRQS